MCGNDQEDGILIQCSKCSKWSHAVCYKIIQDEQVTLVHIIQVQDEQVTLEHIPTFCYSLFIYKYYCDKLHFTDP